MNEATREEEGEAAFIFACFARFFLYCQTNKNNRSGSREQEISKLMTYVYASVCTQTENDGYFVSTDYHY